jgi:hypothetical protein
VGIDSALDGASFRLAFGTRQEFERGGFGGLVGLWVAYGEFHAHPDGTLIEVVIRPRNPLGHPVVGRLCLLSLGALPVLIVAAVGLIPGDELAYNLKGGAQLLMLAGPLMALGAAWIMQTVKRRDDLGNLIAALFDTTEVPPR